MCIVELVKTFQTTDNVVEAREVAFQIAKLIPINYDESSHIYAENVRSAAIYFAGTGHPLCLTPDFPQYGPRKTFWEWSRLSLT